MDAFVTYCNEQPVLVLAGLLALGTLLGSVRIYGISLGASGVLFAAMAAGHYGVVLPGVVRQLGVVFFVYAVGLQAGPHFLRTVRRHGLSFIWIAVVTLGLAWAITFGCAELLGIDGALATGIYTGAMTSTPGLAASLQVLEDPSISVGYGLAYPLGLISVVVFAQTAPRLLGIDLDVERERAMEGQSAPRIESLWLRITNPLVVEKTIGEVESMFGGGAVISRVVDKYVAMPPMAETQFQIDQHVRVVGSMEEVRQLELLLGPVDGQFKEPRSSLSSATLVVTATELCGKTLSELKFRGRYGVTITRLWRDELEFVPHAKTTLEFGDEVRVVGDEADLKRLAPVLGHHSERLSETSFLSLGLGLLAGVLLGAVPMGLPGGLSFTLGMAGGPLVAGLVAGHFGRIARFNFRMPLAARKFVNDFGLLLFLSGAGVAAGSSFVSVIREQGAVLLLAALIVALVPLMGAWVMTRHVLKWDALNCLGAVCGAMTSTPGLGAVTKVADCSVPSTAYVAVYPFALLAITLIAPLLGLALQ